METALADAAAHMRLRHAAPATCPRGAVARATQDTHSRVVVGSHAATHARGNPATGEPMRPARAVAIEWRSLTWRGGRAKLADYSAAAGDRSVCWGKGRAGEGARGGGLVGGRSAAAAAAEAARGGGQQVWQLRSAALALRSPAMLLLAL